MRHSKVVLATVMLGLLVLTAARAAEKTGPPAPPGQTLATAPAGPSTTGGGPKFRCEEASYAAEDVWAGDKVEHEFTVHNDGDAPLEIPKVTRGCGCLAVKFDKVIGPGKQGKIKVALTTPRMTSHEVKKTFTVTTNDPENKRVVLTVKAKVKPRIAMDPPLGPNFGRVTTESELTRTIKLTNNTETPMKLEPVPPAGRQESVFTASLKEIEPGKVAELTVTARPPFKEGANQTYLQYKTGIKEEPEISVRCHLNSPAVVELIPSLIGVSVPATNTYERKVQVKYNGSGTMKIQSVEAPDKSIGLELTEVKPGRIFNIGVKIPPGFDPASNRPMNIEVKTDVAEKPTVRIPIRVTRRPRGHRPPQRTQPPQVTPAVDAESLIGRPAPVGMLATTDGGRTRIGTGTGKVTVLNFWESWDEFSSRQVPVVDQVGQFYARKGVEVLHISTDDLRPGESVRELAARLDLKMPVALDPEHVASARYGVTRVPTLFLIGGDGVVEAVHRGAGRNTEELEAFAENLRAELDVLLGTGTRRDFPSPRPAAGPTSDIATSPGPPATARTEPQAPGLRLDSLRQDTGRHKPAEAVEYTIYYRNEGRQPLKVESVTAPKGVTVDPQYTKLLQPGMTGSVECAFTAPDKPGPFAHRLTVGSNDPAHRELAVTLTGTTRPYLEVNPPTGVDFGRNPRTHSMGRMATVIYNGPGPINYLSARSSSPEFEATVKTIGSGPNAMVVVNSKPPLQLGENKAVINVTTDCKQQPTVEVPVELYLPPRIEVEPPDVTVAKSARLQRKTVLIRNNGLQSLHILGIETSNARMRTQFYPEPDGLSYKLALVFPTNFTCSPQGEKVTIRTDDREFSRIVITIRAAAGTAGEDKAVSRRP